MGDGAGAMVLEEYEHAKARGAKIYAEVIGFGMSGDAFHVTAPPENGEGARKSMVKALADARHRIPDQVQYINAHATSTELGDRAETTAIHRAFGAAAESPRGELDQVHDGTFARRRGRGRGDILRARAARPDRAADDQSAISPARAATSITCRTRRGTMPLDTALSNSFGFGGTNGSLIFRRI